MIALLSALIGFLGAAFPDFIKLFQAQKDRQHEITLLKLQMEYAREKLASAGAQARDAQLGRLQEIELQAGSEEARYVGGRVKESLVGIAWVDALSGSVRPLVTYAFVLLYGLVKAAQFSLLVNPALPWQTAFTPEQALVALWGEDDVALFTAMIAFWFGQRSFGKFRHGRV